MNGKKTPITLRKYLEWVKETNGRFLPDDDPIREFCKNAGIDEGLLYLAWLVFKDRFYHTDEKQKCWRAKFRNYVKNNWFRLWYINKDGEIEISNQGKVMKKAMGLE